MKINLTVLFSIILVLYLSCSVKNKIPHNPPIAKEINYSLFIDEVITYGKENMGFAFKHCTKIKASAHLDENYYCQFRRWKRSMSNYSSEDATLPDTSFLFDQNNHFIDLKLDESIINHCVEIVSGAKEGEFITSGLPQGTLVFSPLIPTTNPHFFILWVHVVRDRDPPEMVFSFIKEGNIYKVTAGSWDDHCF